MSTARRGREIFSSEKILVTESLRLQGVMNDYDDEIFWDKLELCLGKRDFLRTITEEEKKQIKKNGDRQDNCVWSSSFELKCLNSQIGYFIKFFSSNSFKTINT